MPSRFEPFGIAPLEALVTGMPAVVRDACAMPELIHPGQNGALVRTLAPDDLAASIVRCLDDDMLYERCEANRSGVAARFSWGRVASRIISGVERRLQRAG
jgi:glycosyltransferase involved in cell wall biosynthesis